MWAPIGRERAQGEIYQNLSSSSKFDPYSTPENFDGAICFPCSDFYFHFILYLHINIVSNCHFRVRYMRCPVDGTHFVQLFQLVNCCQRMNQENEKLGMPLYP